MKNNKYPEIDFKDVKDGFPMDRRNFLKATGSGLFILFTVKDASFFTKEKQLRLQQGYPSDFNAYLKISEEGRVACYTGKIEMGQGIITSLAQMLADELDVSLDSIDMVLGDTDLCPYDRGTFGSLTTRFFGPALRAAGAEGRSVLLEMASEKLKVPVKNLEVDNGVVYEKKNKKNKISYSQLTKGKRIERHVNGHAEIKKPSGFKIIGKSVNRMDADLKVTGKAKYAGDIQFPGMLYAKILRSPSHGAKLISADTSGAEKIKDVKVIRQDDLIAVLHKYPDVAEDALSKIKAKFDKSPSKLNDRNIFDHLLKAAPDGDVIASGGDLSKGEKNSEKVIEETYFDGYKAHAPIEPHTATVNIEGERVIVWASTQTPFPAKEEVAKALNIPAKNVRVMQTLVGGGFGGKTRNLQIVEAALLAKLTGKPVQVAWTREEEFFFDSFRPAAVVKIKSGITKQGKLNSWDYHVYFAGERGSQQFYNIPNHSTSVHGSGWGGDAHPFATGAWRAPGNNTNTFARESQISVMAHEAGIDQVEFRLQNLADEKMKKVLKTAAGKFGWKPSKSRGKGYGVACGIDAGTSVATIAEVEVDKTNGNVKVNRVVCAQDMGLVINPEGATIQMEGCITMGLGYALREDIHFKNGEILDVNFDSYEIPHFSWLPKIETVLIDNKEAAPQGGGEPAIVTMGAVIANAIFDAIGVRVFQLPMNPERVLEAIKKG
ncbi:MAG: molybdopterin cofactor-binding domain-containing protein [Ignavibacteriaceae bacterium]